MQFAPCLSIPNSNDHTSEASAKKSNRQNRPFTDESKTGSLDWLPVSVFFVYTKPEITDAIDRIEYSSIKIEPLQVLCRRHRRWRWHFSYRKLGCCRRFHRTYRAGSDRHPAWISWLQSDRPPQARKQRGSKHRQKKHRSRLWDWRQADGLLALPCASSIIIDMLPLGLLHVSLFLYSTITSKNQQRFIQNIFQSFVDIQKPVVPGPRAFLL